jgi:hypothetical protein
MTSKIGDFELETVRGTGHYLNRRYELAAGVLDLLKAHPGEP